MREAVGCNDHKGYSRKDIYSILFSFWNTRVSILLSARSVFIAVETVIFVAFVVYGIIHSVDNGLHHFKLVYHGEAKMEQ